MYFLRSQFSKALLFVSVLSEKEKITTAKYIFTNNYLESITLSQSHTVTEVGGGIWKHNMSKMRKQSWELTTGGNNVWLVLWLRESRLDYMFFQGERTDSKCFHPETWGNCFSTVNKRNYTKENLMSSQQETLLLQQLQRWVLRNDVQHC